MRCRLVLSVLVVAGCSMVAAANGESKEGDPFFERRGIDDRATFFIGGINSRADTTAQVNSNVGIGSTLLLEIFGEIGVSPGPILTVSEHVSETVPLPVVGVYTVFTLTPSEPRGRLRNQWE